MTRAKELAGLIERVEAAAGPDRELDSAVFAACGMHINPNPPSFEYGRWPEETADGSTFYRIDRITASIDAALALVERVLPGIFWVIGQGKTNSVEKLFGCQLLFGTEEIIGSGESDHAPLAILLALLKALQESHDAE
jgi:hypothetical protein